MKHLISLLAFIIFSFVLAQNVPADPPPPPPPPTSFAVPIGGHIPTGLVAAFIAGYGMWRMRGKK